MIAVPQCPLSSSDIAAWVQAVGSISAIALALGVAIWQSRKAQELTLFTIAQQRKADHLRIANTLLEIAKNALKVQKHMARKLPNREAIHLAAEDRLPFDMPEVYSVEKALDNIELHLLPANLVAPALIVAATFRQFRIKLDMVFDTHRQLDGAHFTDFFETTENMQKSMLLTVADLEQQVTALG